MRPFDPATFEREGESYIDEASGEVKVRLKDANTIRWRAKDNPDGGKLHSPTFHAFQSLLKVLKFGVHQASTRFPHQKSLMSFPSNGSKFLCNFKYSGVCSSTSLYLFLDVKGSSIFCVYAQCMQSYSASCTNVPPSFCLPSGEPQYESNARFVRWSDGSLQLLLGDEVLDTTEQDMSMDHHYLFVRHQGLIQVRPHTLALLHRTCRRLLGAGSRV